MNEFKYTYSDSLNEMVVERFYYKNRLYIWNDYDLVYYNIDSEEEWFEEVPSEATSKRSS